MPRLFPHLSRSSKENTRDEYAGYGGYNPGYYEHDYGYDEWGLPRQPPRAPSAWRRAFSKKSKTGGRAYYGEGEVPGFQRSKSQRATVDDYPEHRAGQPYPSSEDTESYVNIPSRNHSPVPIVQRESSLSRLQAAFADHGTYSPATMEPHTPMRDTPRYSPRQMPVPMTAPVEMATVHEARREPQFVDNPPMDGFRPAVMEASRHHYERPPYTDRSPYQVYAQPSTQGYQIGPGQEYPPVVVVVQRGEDGEPDTYYVVPGGAPVIFEDDDGNEITRVGDFSGHYRPQPPRPVIVQDEHGREIFRTGFNDGYDHRSPNVQLYGFDRRPGHRSRSAHYAPAYDDRHDDRYYDDGHRSHRSRSRRRYGDYDDYDDYDDRGYRSRRSRERPYAGSSPPNVVFIDPSETSSAGRRHENVLHGSTSRSHRGDYYDSSHRQPYASPSFIELDTQSRRHASGGSSRSGGSSNRGYYGYR